MRVTIYDSKTNRVVFDGEVDEARTSYQLPVGSDFGFRFEPKKEHLK